MFLAAAGILMMLPLILAALLPRLAVVASCIMLALIAAATYWELPLLRVVTSTSGPDFWHFTLINICQSMWILLVAGLLRAKGFALYRGNSDASALPAICP
jgi:hypothetical protein